MILLDVNVVLALYARQHQHHVVARGWLDAAVEARHEFGIPTLVWHSFLRLVTNPRVVDPVVSVPDAFGFVSAVRAGSGHQSIEPGRAHLSLLERVCVDGAARADLVPDAVLASIAIECGAELASFDRDFARFPGLRWVVPSLSA